MKVLLIADDDQSVKRIEPERAEVVISCGDLIDQSILEAARLCSSTKIFAVKGNHDANQAFAAPIFDLHLRTENYGGLKFGGFNGAWRYKPRGHFLYEQDEVVRLLAHFPAVDVFVAHNSPRHVHDRDDEVHLGFDAFTPYIQRAKPRAFIHGHQHVNRESRLGETRVIGVYGVKLIDI
jgi:Icc-related predicted phosphoesterase